MAANNHKKFEKFIGELAHLKPEEMLERAVDLSDESIKAVPLRFRIIALGLENRQMTLEDVNRMLKEKGCEKLYARSFWEATLIYAIDRGYNYKKWKELYKKCEGLSLTVNSYWFSGKTVTYGELRRYLQENSNMENGMLVTNMHTQQIENALRETAGEDEDLLEFLKENIGAFSDVRERARYYFCKYLYYFLNRRIEKYLTACREKWDKERYEEALAELKCIKNVTGLRRHKTKPDEVKLKWMDGASLSYGFIFQAFEAFYGYFMSTDWITYVMTQYNDRAEDVPKNLRNLLIEALFRNKGDQKAAKGETQLYLQRMEEWKEKQEQYGGLRRWENVARDYMRGIRDLDRTALICYLAYLSSDADMPEAHQLTEERLNVILERCGYPRLDPEDDFDGTVVEYILSGTWKGVLDETVNDAASQGENSKWYKFYDHKGTFVKTLKYIVLPKKPQKQKK